MIFKFLYEKDIKICSLFFKITVIPIGITNNLMILNCFISESKNFWFLLSKDLQNIKPLSFNRVILNILFNGIATNITINDNNNSKSPSIIFTQIMITTIIKTIFKISLYCVEFSPAKLFPIVLHNIFQHTKFYLRYFYQYKDKQDKQKKQAFF